MKKLIFFLSITLTLSTFAQVPNYVPTNGLVGWWPFNGNANDESGNGNNGTVNGATLTTDRFGNANSAYYFDGVNSFISVANNPSLYFESNNSFTFGYWLRASSLSATQLSLVLSKQTGSANSQDGFNSNIEPPNSSNYRIQNGSGTPAFSVGTPINSVEINIWIHVTHVWSGNIGEIFINGVLAATSTGTSVVGDNISDLLIGKPNWVATNVKNFHGKIDDIGIWNRALTPCEISALYNAQTLSNPIVDLGGDTLSVCGSSTV